MRNSSFLIILNIFRTPLVPVFSFGETDLYDQVNTPQGSILRKIQDFVKKTTGMAPVIPLGRGCFQYTFGLLPNRRSVFVVGKVYLILLESNLFSTLGLFLVMKIYSCSCSWISF